MTRLTHVETGALQHQTGEGLRKGHRSAGGERERFAAILGDLVQVAGSAGDPAAARAAESTGNAPSVGYPHRDQPDSREPSPEGSDAAAVLAVEVPATAGPLRPPPQPAAAPSGDSGEPADDVGALSAPRLLATEIGREGGVAAAVNRIEAHVIEQATFFQPVQTLATRAEGLAASPAGHGDADPAERSLGGGTDSAAPAGEIANPAASLGAAGAARAEDIPTKERAGSDPPRSAGEDDRNPEPEPAYPQLRGSEPTPGRNASLARRDGSDAGAWRAPARATEQVASAGLPRPRSDGHAGGLARNTVPAGATVTPSTPDRGDAGPAALRDGGRARAERPSEASDASDDAGRDRPPPVSAAKNPGGATASVPGTGAPRSQDHGRARPLADPPPGATTPARPANARAAASAAAGADSMSHRALTLGSAERDIPVAASPVPLGGTEPRASADEAAKLTTPAQAGLESARRTDGGGLQPVSPLGEIERAAEPDVSDSKPRGPASKDRGLQQEPAPADRARTIPAQISPDEDGARDDGLDLTPSAAPIGVIREAPRESRSSRPASVDLGEPLIPAHSDGALRIPARGAREEIGEQTVSDSRLGQPASIGHRLLQRSDLGDDGPFTTPVLNSPDKEARDDGVLGLTAADDLEEGIGGRPIDHSNSFGPAPTGHGMPPLSAPHAGTRAAPLRPAGIILRGADAAGIEVSTPRGQSEKIARREVPEAKLAPISPYEDERDGAAAADRAVPVAGFMEIASATDNGRLDEVRSGQPRKVPVGQKDRDWRKSFLFDDAAPSRAVPHEDRSRATPAETPTPVAAKEETSVAAAADWDGFAAAPPPPEADELRPPQPSSADRAAHAQDETATGTNPGPVPRGQSRDMAKEAYPAFRKPGAEHADITATRPIAARPADRAAMAEAPIAALRTPASANHSAGRDDQGRDSAVVAATSPDNRAVPGRKVASHVWAARPVHDPLEAPPAIAVEAAAEFHDRDARAQTGGGSSEPGGWSPMPGIPPTGAAAERPSPVAAERTPAGSGPPARRGMESESDPAVVRAGNPLESQSPPDAISSGIPVDVAVTSPTGGHTFNGKPEVRARARDPGPSRPPAGLPHSQVGRNRPEAKEITAPASSGETPAPFQAPSQAGATAALRATPYRGQQPATEPSPRGRPASDDQPPTVAPPDPGNAGSAPPPRTVGAGASSKAGHGDFHTIAEASSHPERASANAASLSDDDLPRPDAASGGEPPRIERPLASGATTLVFGPPDATPVIALPSPELQRIAGAISAAAAESPASAATVGPGSPSPVRTLTIELHPTELGVVTVKLRLAGADLSVALHASRTETARLLEGHEEELSRLLAADGHRVEIARIDIAPAGMTAGSAAVQPGGSPAQPGAAPQDGGIGGRSQASANGHGSGSEASPGDRQPDDKPQRKGGDGDPIARLRPGDIYV